MILLWHIRYLDRQDRQFKDRNLWLDTGELDAVTRSAVEASNELERRGGGRAMLKYRHLFKEERNVGEIEERVEKSGRMNSVILPHDYVEDEDGNELTSKQLAVALTGSETAVLVPPGFKQHDIDYMFAEKAPVDIAKLSLSPDQLKILGYFRRDLKELRASAFFKEGPGSLSGSAVSPPAHMTLQTAVTDEEIRSFVTIFRRLYMKTEPASFQRAADVFTGALGGHPVAKWIGAGAADIRASLDRPPHFALFAGPSNPSFTVKRLIDVFLYTQYAHQPDEGRSRQFQECLQEVRNDRAVLTYLFLTEVWRVALNMSNVGQHVALLFDPYCRQHQPICDIVASPAEAHPGIGALEKPHQREDRILREKAAELADAMWREAGQPAGGPDQFRAASLARLRDAMNAERK